MEKYNIVSFEDEAKLNLKKGIDIAANLVTPTLGARGRKIIIQKEFSKPEASDDGYSILKTIKLKDQKQQLGVEVLLDASSATNDKAGDGTTSTALVTQSLVGGLIKASINPRERLLVNQGAGNVLKVSKELRAGAEKVLEYINKNKIEVKGIEQLKQIGRVSSNDEKIGDILATLFHKLGKDASVLSVDSYDLDTTYEIIEGMKIDKGFISGAFVTDGEAQKAVLKNPYILVTDYKIQNPEDFKEILKLFEQKVQDLVIIADDVSGLPLDGLIINKLRAGLRLLAVRAPGFGQMKEHLKDIATLVGATVVSKDAGMEFKDLTPELLGKAEEVISKADETVIIGGKGAKKDIKERVKFLKVQKAEQGSQYEKGKLDERISKLSGGVGIIKVGAPTEIEKEERKAKVDDAIHAVRGAMEDGVVAGGGIALLRASEVLDDSIEGEEMLKKAIQRPFEQILKNADVDVSGIGSKVAANKNKNYGYNVETEEYGDMIAMGIIDPAKVVKTVLQNAVSTSITILTSAGAINLVPDTKKKEQNEQDLYAE